jgi:hypothetical protein
MSYLDHTAKIPTSCNSCSRSGSSMGSMGGSMGTMSEAETEGKVTRAQEHYKRLEKMFEQLKTGDYASLLKAREALESLLSGVPDEVVQRHLGNALGEFLGSARDFTFESVLVSIRAAFLATTAAGFGVDLFFREAADRVEIIARGARKAVSDAK